MTHVFHSGIQSSVARNFVSGSGSGSANSGQNAGTLAGGSMPWGTRASEAGSELLTGTKSTQYIVKSNLEGGPNIMSSLLKLLLSLIAPTANKIRLHLPLPRQVSAKTTHFSKVSHLIQYSFSENLFTSYQCVKCTS